MYQMIRGHGSHGVFFFRSDRQTQTWYIALRTCFLSSSVEFSFSSFRGEVENVLGNKRPWQQTWDGKLVFPLGPKKKYLVKIVELFVEFRSAISEEKSKMYQ